MKSQSTIATQEAHRIAKRLLNHWKHKFEVDQSIDSQSEQHFYIFMPDATVQLIASTQSLEIQLSTEREDYATLQQVILDHLNRMAQQQFKLEWLNQN